MVSFSGTGITVDAGSVQVIGGDIHAKISTSSNAAPGSRNLILQLSNPTKTLELEEKLTVYRGIIPSLVELLNRPAPGQAQAFPGVQGGGPRTQEQENRIQAVINATSENTLRSAWHTFTANDASAIIPPTKLTPELYALFRTAALGIEGNSNKVAIGNPSLDPQPPDVPLAMWKAYLDFLDSIESAGLYLALAGASGENSYGRLQFNDGRADLNNFTGTGVVVPIYQAGIVKLWKTKLLAANTVASLKNTVDSLNDDWRADPVATFINGIRSSQAYIGTLMKAGNTNYDANDDFRPDAGSGRAHGHGSQRDFFEFLGVMHRLPSDVLGGTFDSVDYAGGLVVAPTPNEWHTTGTDPVSQKPYMHPDGTSRANSARNYYDNNAPAGGFQ